jgi:hypothetical protein
MGEFVEYNEALDLQELGMTTDYFAVYSVADKSRVYAPDYIRGGAIPAPLYQQVVDWFEKEHQIFIGKTGYNDGVTPKRFVYHVDSLYCDEQSYDGAIKEAIKIIKQ